MGETGGRERRELITIPVTGMTCASCVARVEKALSKTEGVSEASINFAAEKVTVAYNLDSVSPEELVEAIEGVGYTAEGRETTLGITGMTCASCAGRVEKALKKVPGVLDANVNLANERATIEYLVGEAQPRDLERAIEGAGYGMVRGGEEDSVEDAHEREYKDLRNRFLWAAVLTALILIGSLPMMLGFMPPLPMGWLNLGLLALATPVQFWAGWRFYKGAWGALKHGQANMNTLVAAGALYPFFAGGTVPELLRPFLGEYGFLNPVLAAAAYGLVQRNRAGQCPAAAPGERKLENREEKHAAQRR